MINAILCRLLKVVAYKRQQGFAVLLRDTDLIWRFSKQRLFSTEEENVCRLFDLQNTIHPF